MNIKMKKKSFSSFLLLILTVNLNVSANIITVSDAEQLESAAENAIAGDTVIVLNGRYDTGGSVTLYNSGNAENPIVIMSNTPGMVELSGETYFDFRQCAYIVVKGFIFTSTDVTVLKLEASNNIRITDNIFRLGETSSLKWVIIQGIWNDANAQSHHNRIDHNLFENKHFPGNCITVDGSGDPVYQSSQYDRIDHNYFRNVGPRVENEMETIRVGWSEMSMSSGFTTIENNLFEDCDGDPEIISVKTCDDTVRYNTFRRCQGTLSLRHGNRSVINGNYFFGEGKAGTGGVRVYGDDHKIFNNYFEGLTGYNWDAALTLTNGDYDGGTGYSKHFRINRAIIVHNTMIDNLHNIEIGYTNNGKYSKPPRDVVMANNLVYAKQNDIVKIFSAADNMSWRNNMMYPDSVSVIGVSFNSDENIPADPLLTKEDLLFKLSSASPAIDALDMAFSFVIEDMDGQIRDDLSDIGADEYSLSPITRHPLLAKDVGPSFTDQITGIALEDENRGITSFTLSQNYPNPFNSSTTIRFFLSRQMDVKLTVYNVSGEQILTPVHGNFSPGNHQFRIEASSLASGIYFYRLSTGSGSVSRKMFLLK